MPPNGEHQLEKKKIIFDFCGESYRYKTRYEIFMYLECFASYDCATHRCTVSHMVSSVKFKF